MISDPVNDHSDLKNEHLTEVLPEPEPIAESSPIHEHNHAKSLVIKSLRGVQKYSAYGIATFAGLHLTSTLISPPISQNWANSAFMAARSVYQNEIGESVLVYGSSGFHIASGSALHIYRMWQHYSDTGEIIWKSYSNKMVKSGWILVALTGVHMAAMRWGPSFQLGDSSLISLEYVDYGLQTRPFLVSASSLALSGAFFTHSVPGLCRYIGLNLDSIKRLLIISGGLIWTFSSLVTLKHHEMIQGWMAEQFSLGYHYLDLLHR